MTNTTKHQETSCSTNAAPNFKQLLQYSVCAESLSLLFEVHRLSSPPNILNILTSSKSRIVLPLPSTLPTSHMPSIWRQTGDKGDLDTRDWRLVRTICFELGKIFQD